MTDPWANLEPCPDCEDWWCVPCDVHWYDCPCPGPHDPPEEDSDDDKQATPN